MGVMNAAFFAGGGTVQLRRIPCPEPGPGEVLLQVRTSALCGSELHAYRAETSSSRIPGHEMVGEVVEVNEAAHVRVGQRVAVQVLSGCGLCIHCLSGAPEHCSEARVHTGGHAEYVALPATCCLPLPDDLPWEEGVLLGGDTIGTPYHALSRLRVSASDTAAVFGCGPVGLGAVALLCFFGARVLAVEPVSYRRSLACQLGADEAIDPVNVDAVARIEELTDGQGVSIAMDCSGVPITTQLALDSAAIHGRVALIGEKPVATIRPSDQFIRKELTVIGSWYFTTPDYFRVLDLRKRGLDVAGLITHRFALADADRAFATFASGESGKVVIVQGDP